MPPTRIDITAEIKVIIPGLIKKEHEYRVQYLHDKYDALQAQPGQAYAQLEENSLWGGLYTQINWLAHFKFLKVKDVDKDLPQWLSEVFGWPEDVARAFWSCGRDPIAHTGSRSPGYSQNFNRTKFYILLSFGDPQDWSASPYDGYRAMAPMKKDIGGSPLSAQQLQFFYEPVEKLLSKLVEDIDASISGLDYTKIISLQKVCMATVFVQDDSSLFRMNDLLRLYGRAK